MTGRIGVDFPGVTVAGSLAYVAASNEGVYIIDVSDPAHPVEAGYYDTPGAAQRSPSVVGNSIYVADRGGGLVILGFMPHQLTLPLVLRN